MGQVGEQCSEAGAGMEMTVPTPRNEGCWGWLLLTRAAGEPRCWACARCGEVPCGCGATLTPRRSTHAALRLARKRTRDLLQVEPEP